MKIRSAQAELVRMDLQTVIEKMNLYAATRLRNVDVKQLEGKTPDDFTSDTLLKVLEGIRSWEDSSTDDFEKFLFGCLRSECSHFLEKIDRRAISITTVYDNDNEDDNTEKLLAENN